MSGIQLNGATFYPSSIEEDDTKVGRLIQSANGKRTFMHRTSDGTTPIFQRTWSIKWETVSSTIADAVRVVAHLTTTFTYISERGSSFTVQCEDGALRISTGVIDSDGVPRYDVELTIHEA